MAFEPAPIDTFPPPKHRPPLIQPFSMCDESGDSRSAAIEEDRLRLEADPHYFHAEAWKVLHHGVPYIREWYHDAMIEHLAAIDELKWLMIHCPYRIGKTYHCSIIFRARRWALDPTRKFLGSSFSKHLVTEINILTRRLILSPWYQARWPLNFAEDMNQAGRYATTKGGYCYTVLYGSGGTGDGGDDLTVDDAQCGADMYSAAKMDVDEKWWHDTWLSRRNHKEGPDESNLIVIGQRLGWRDVYNSIRLSHPDRWNVLALEARKTSVHIQRYWRRSEDGETWNPVDLPFCQSALLNDGRVVDHREPGDLLTIHLPDREIDGTLPSVRDSQLQQRPKRITSGIAKFHRFDRAKHLKSFCERMGVLRGRIQLAIRKALQEGWKFGSSWDHGLDAKREWCGIRAWNERLHEIWMIRVWVNTKRQGVYEDAIEVRAMLDEIGLPPLAIEESYGDVGTIKNSTDGTPKLVNRELSTITYPVGHPRQGQPVLGFDIMTPRKSPGSVDIGVEVINMALGSLSLYLDEEGCPLLADAMESWQGGEESKDGCDMLSYGVRAKLQEWLYQQPGGSGSSSS